MYFTVNTYFIRQIIFSEPSISLNIYRLICRFFGCQKISPLATVYQPHFSKFLQQNIELGQQVCTGTVSEQHFSELLSSSLVECLLLTPRFPGSNPETGELWEEEESFIECVL